MPPDADRLVDKLNAAAAATSAVADTSPVARRAAQHNLNIARDISRIVIHCSATANGRRLARPGGVETTDAEVIDRWHRERGWQRLAMHRARAQAHLTSIGYHWIISPSGHVAAGRDLAEVGAHVGNYNAGSIGICMVGTDAFTLPQWQSLAALVRMQARVLCIPLEFCANPNKHAGVLGHRDHPAVAKTCPGFSVERWLAGGLEPVAGQIVEAIL